LSNIYETGFIILLNLYSILENIKLKSGCCIEWFKAKSCSNSFIKSSSHIVIIVIGVFSLEEKDVAEELEGQPCEAL
jgi:hypothetical protein